MFNKEMLEIISDTLDELRNELDWCSFVLDMATKPHGEHTPTEAELAEMEALL